MRNRIYSIIVCIIAIAISLFYKTSCNTDYTWMYGDALGYYVYLPATFIYGNLLNLDEFSDEESLPVRVIEDTRSMKQAGALVGIDRALNQYTYGVALMESPFFLIAHAYEKLTSDSVNGYEGAYIVLIQISSIIFILLGCFLTFKVLRRHFDHLPSLLSLLLIFLGTHMFWFTLEQAGMSHQPLFFLYALLLYLAVKIHETQKNNYIILTGFVLGIITLIRPTDIIAVSIPLLYGVYNKETLQNKLKLLKKKLPAIGVAVIVFLLPMVPQLLYWKALTGKYIFYSYGNQEFHWMHPQIIKGLFYFSNGWLPYAPMMLFAIAGLLVFKRYKNWLPVILVLLPVYIYVIYSWFCYNYINGMGSRPMIHLYPLLAIPLAAFIQYISRQRIIVKSLFATVSVFFIAVIFSLTTLMAKGMLRSEEANAKYVLGVLFKDNITYKDFVTYDIGVTQPDENEMIYVGLLGNEDHDNPDSLTTHFVDDPNNEDSSDLIYHLWKGQDYDNGQGRLEVPYIEGMFKNADWIKCSADFMPTSYIRRDSKIFIFEVQNEDGTYKEWYGCKIPDKIGLPDSACEHADSFNFFHNEVWIWSKLYFYVPVPDNISKGDIVRLFIWNQDRGEMFYDDLTLELYKEK